eukprot:COSAG02_NODE_25615_length_653_cov_1.101083_1_plen_163_part_01
MSAQEEAVANQAERAAAMQQHGHGHAESAGGRAPTPLSAASLCLSALPLSLSLCVCARACVRLDARLPRSLAFSLSVCLPVCLPASLLPASLVSCRSSRAHLINEPCGWAEQVLLTITTGMHMMRTVSLHSVTLFFLPLVLQPSDQEITWAEQATVRRAVTGT